MSTPTLTRTTLSDAGHAIEDLAERTADVAGSVVDTVSDTATHWAGNLAGAVSTAAGTAAGAAEHVADAADQAAKALRKPPASGSHRVRNVVLIALLVIAVAAVVKAVTSRSSSVPDPAREAAPARGGDAEPATRDATGVGVSSPPGPAATTGRAA